MPESRHKPIEYHMVPADGFTPPYTEMRCVACQEPYPCKVRKTLDALQPFIGGLHYPEAAHCKADKILLAHINDPEITEAFRAIEKWYS